MSKKLFSTAKWKGYLKKRQAYQLQRAKAAKSGKHGIPPLIRYHAQQLNFEILKVPTTFSIIEEPEAAIDFLLKVRRASLHHNLTIDMKDVTHITIDAITALIAEIASLESLRLVKGNDPQAEGCRDVLIQSGFFNHVKSRKLRPPSVQGRISRRKSKIVESVTAKELIQIGSSAAFGAPRKCPAAYSALVECMSNTHNHATGKSDMGRETWYSTVYGDSGRKRICYSFLDTGVGIFRSVRYSKLKRAYKAVLRGENETHILKDILAGQVASRTGLPFRGKGLPGIYQSLQAGRIKSLVIVSNRVYANVDESDFRMLPKEFPGTLLYWESEA